MSLQHSQDYLVDLPIPINRLIFTYREKSIIPHGAVWSYTLFTPPKRLTLCHLMRYHN